MVAGAAHADVFTEAFCGPPTAINAGAAPLGAAAPAPARGNLLLATGRVRALVTFEPRDRVVADPAARSGTLSRRMASTRSWRHTYSAAALMARLFRIPLDVNTWEA